MKKHPFVFRLPVLVLILLSGIGAAEVICQDPELDAALRHDIFPLLTQYKLEKALAACEKFDRNSPDVIAVESIIYSLMGNRDKDKELIQKGYVMLAPYKSRKDNYYIHVALAMSFGIQANHSGLKEQIRLSEFAMQHCKDALKIDKNLPHPNFILGRFYYELSRMSKVTASLAKTMIDPEEIERASFELSLSYLNKASSQRPNRFLYNYFTGAAYEGLGNKERAMYYYRLADNNHRYNADDWAADKDLQKKLR